MRVRSPLEERIEAIWRVVGGIRRGGEKGGAHTPGKVAVFSLHDTRSQEPRQREKSMFASHLFPSCQKLLMAQSGDGNTATGNVPLANQAQEATRQVGISGAQPNV